MTTTNNRPCPACRGSGFCLPTCPASSPRQQYLQRTAFHASVMLDVVKDRTDPEYHAYWHTRLVQAQRALAEPALPRAA